ncbi:hypothetical protein J437_LFUL013679 [Ladona fulva]|uniref:Tc1-like transposase DDE domain-containing protein n=1 Tax=Ladona fulva TaxID=123851 RepID=A0A8K0KG05_LADFU|nr:hypothetical protein J437_LFUL013679 [Ladona fulva]
MRSEGTIQTYIQKKDHQFYKVKSRTVKYLQMRNMALPQPDWESWQLVKITLLSNVGGKNMTSLVNSILLRFAMKCNWKGQRGNKHALEKTSLLTIVHVFQTSHVRKWLKETNWEGALFHNLSAVIDQGFVENARLVYLAKKNTGDYHDEMDSRRFEEFCPTSGEGSIVVMDNASFHSRKQEKIPISSCKKEELKISFIIRNRISLKRFEVELTKIVDSVWNKYTTYNMDETTKGKKI